MSNQNLIRINILDLIPGSVVHQHGARFEILSVKIVTEKDEQYLVRGLDKIMSAQAKWFGGQIETGYFGPCVNWNFQGNKNVSVNIEA